jgi:hypothetical protein
MNMRVLVLSGYTRGKDSKGQRAWLKAVMNNHINYCFKHNYSYKFCTNYSNPASSENCNPFYLGTWSKPGFILSELNNNFDYIFWIDSDSIFTNFNISLDDLISTDKDLIFTGDYSDVFNGGHLLIKNSIFSLNFIKMWEESRFINFSNNRANLGFEITSDGFALGDQTLFNALLNCSSLDNEKIIEGFNIINGYEGNDKRKYKNWKDYFFDSKKFTSNIYEKLINKDFINNIHIVPHKRLNSYLDTNYNILKYTRGDPILHFVSTSKNSLENRCQMIYKLIEIGIYIDPIKTIVKNTLKKIYK